MPSNRSTAPAKAKALIILRASEPALMMRDTVHAFIESEDRDAIMRSVDLIVARVQTYVPGYRLKQRRVSGDIARIGVTAQAFTGGRRVKGFNHLIAGVLEQVPAVHGVRRLVFLASIDDGTAAEIGALAENLGFSPIKLGGLSQGGLLV